MKLQYLGTAAAEAIPALFCECPLCEKARELGGRELRLRSGAVLDDHVLLDFPPDVYESCRRFGVALHKVTDVIVTHSHGDHLDCDELAYRQDPGFCIRKEKTKLRVWGTADIWKTLEESRDIDLIREAVEFHTLRYYEPVAVEGMTVTPLPADHMQNAPKDGEAFVPNSPNTPCNYLIEKDGKRLLYAHDTGIFFDEVFDFLRGKRLDVASLDCCCATLSCRYGHMGLPENAEVIARLRENGAADAETRFFANHFSHNGLRVGEELYTHDKLYAACLPYGIVPTCDGMIVEI